jgi:hypothetical protein
MIMHNDYLELLTDGGVIGAGLCIFYGSSSDSLTRLFEEKRPLCTPILCRRARRRCIPSAA